MSKAKKATAAKAATPAKATRTAAKETVKSNDKAERKMSLLTAAGKTPEQTLYSAMVREIKSKGESARFTKEGGLFRIKR